MNPKRIGSWFKQQKTNHCAVKTVLEQKLKKNAKNVQKSCKNILINESRAGEY